MKNNNLCKIRNNWIILWDSVFRPKLNINKIQMNLWDSVIRLKLNKNKIQINLWDSIYLKIMKIPKIFI